MLLRAAKNAYDFDRKALYKKGYRLPVKGDEIFNRTSAKNNVVDRGIPFAAHYIKDAYGIGGAGFKAKKIVEDARAGRSFATAPEKVLPAPGSAAPRIKTSGPTQADQIAAGLEANKPRKRLSEYDRIKFGDKDMRSLLAEEKLKIADKLAGGGFSRDELVDMLNQPGVQTSPAVLDAFNNSQYMRTAVEMGKEGKFKRPELETQDFVGEGQFGRVSELAPGYVIKEQAPLVEWGGYQGTDADPSGARGSLIGKIHDHRDVAREVDQMNFLNKMHIGPKAEAFNVLPDGSTEVIMRDLRDNFTVGEDVLVSNAEAGNFLKNRLLLVKRMQQEGASANAGLLLQDRHDANFMVNNMTGRPIQIDPSGTTVEGVGRDIEVADKVARGFQAAGLEDEADIYIGLFNEAQERGDVNALRSLAQQGLSRLQKIKAIPQNYTRVLPGSDSGDLTLADMFSSVPF